MATGPQKDAPTREVGSNVLFGGQTFFPGVPGAGGSGGVAGWSSFATNELDHVPDLRGHQLYRVCDQMLTNPQIWALFIGMMLPLLDYDVALEPGDADADMTGTLAADLGLPVGLPAPGDTAPALEPGVFRFDFLQHLWEALFAPAYGFYFFEQVGQISDDDGLWHLQRLDARSPHDILDVVTDEHGGLEYIIHPGITKRIGNRPLIEEVAIPASQLVGYVWLPNARRRWRGHSMLRPLYEPWLLRDRGVRIDMINHQKAGGVPGVETDDTWQGGDLSELQQMASAFNVGEESGFALPPGAHLKLARAGGTDVIASIRYHDETMARAWGAMVRQLGQTMTGSRALGNTFADLEEVVRGAIMRWFAGTFREHVIEDWWMWNVPPGPDGKPTAHPALAWRKREAPAATPPADVPRQDQPPGALPNPPVAPPSQHGGAAAQAGRLVPASTVHQGRRDRVSDNDRAGVAAAALPNRPLRRQPYEAELRAAVDYAAMDVDYNTGVNGVEDVLAAWLPDLIRAAEDSIDFTKAGQPRQRLTRLNAAQLTIPAPDTAALAVVLEQAARAGVRQAVGELAAQGVQVEPLTDDEVTALIADHAAAVTQQVANGIQLAASRRAVQVNAGRAPGEVSTLVGDYLRGLQHQWERDQLAGAVQAAMNAARLQVFATVPTEHPEAFYSSELLDAATCGPCRQVDGKQYVSVTDAQRDYSFGGFNGCQGGPRCRGTVIAVMREAELSPGTPSHLGPG
jgi:hypothetical protein